MKDLIKIAVDAMGGDNSPNKIIDGIIHNNRNNKENFYKIFGDKEKIQNYLGNRLNKNFYEIIDTKKKLKVQIVLSRLLNVVKILVCGYLLTV